MIATRMDRSPDALDPGCKATGLVEPGVVFPTVEPMQGSHMFIGTTALHEAVSAYHNITVDEAKARLTQSQNEEVQAAQAEARRYRLRNETLERLAFALTEAGFVIELE